MEGSNTLFSSPKIPRARARISSKFIDKLRMRPQKCSTACFRETERRLTKLVLLPLYQCLSRNSSFEKTENETRR